LLQDHAYKKLGLEMPIKKVAELAIGCDP
jgi:hypothetical protein